MFCITLFLALVLLSLLSSLEASAAYTWDLRTLINTRLRCPRAAISMQGDKETAASPLFEAREKMSPPERQREGETATERDMCLHFWGDEDSETIPVAPSLLQEGSSSSRGRCLLQEATRKCLAVSPGSPPVAAAAAVQETDRSSCYQEEIKQQASEEAAAMHAATGGDS